MSAPHTIALFMISTFALNLTPGPAILFVLSRALDQGDRRRCSASPTTWVIHGLAAVFGLAALF